jgi:hypothetical protein
VGRRPLFGALVSELRLEALDVHGDGCHHDLGRAALAFRKESLAASLEVVGPPLKLYQVQPSLGVGVSVMIPAVVMRIPLEALLLSTEPLGLAIEGLRKGQRFASATHLVFVM